MKIVRFLSRVAFICNISFLLFIFFRWMEVGKPAAQGGEALQSVPLFKDIIITLGIIAIVLNIALAIIYLIFLFSGKISRVPRWLVLINILFLLVQVYYFFFF